MLHLEIKKEFYTKEVLVRFQAKNLKLTFHSGKDDQTADKTLMNKAGGLAQEYPHF